MYFWIKYFITLEEDFYKIAAFILIAIFICACNAVKEFLMENNSYKKIKLP
jgi:hypothetical protein